MAGTARGPVRAGSAPGPVIGPQEPAVAPILETTELRVVSSGPLPSEVHRWVMDRPRVVERRCDVYILDGRVDVGVKWRGRTTLELKVRSAVEAPAQLTDGLVGQPEVWRKWSPADGLVDVSETTSDRLDVHKEIIRWRFDMDGAESTYTTGPPPEGSGCDVEVVRVRLGAADGWTFALTAFGPRALRLDALRVAWSAVVVPDTVLEHLRRCQPMGYPEWLSLGPVAER